MNIDSVLKSHGIGNNRLPIVNGFGTIWEKYGIKDSSPNYDLNFGMIALISGQSTCIIVILDAKTGDVISSKNLGSSYGNVRPIIKILSTKYVALILPNKSISVYDISTETTTLLFSKAYLGNDLDIVFDGTHFFTCFNTKQFGKYDLTGVTIFEITLAISSMAKIVLDNSINRIYALGISQSSVYSITKDGSLLLTRTSVLPSSSAMDISVYGEYVYLYSECTSPYTQRIYKLNRSLETVGYYDISDGHLKDMPIGIFKDIYYYAHFSSGGNKSLYSNRIIKQSGDFSTDPNSYSVRGLDTNNLTKIKDVAINPHNGYITCIDSINNALLFVNEISIPTTVTTEPDTLTILSCKKDIKHLII